MDLIRTLSTGETLTIGVSYIGDSDGNEKLNVTILASDPTGKPIMPMKLYKEQYPELMDEITAIDTALKAAKFTNTGKGMILANSTINAYTHLTIKNVKELVSLGTNIIADLGFEDPHKSMVIPSRRKTAIDLVNFAVSGNKRTVDMKTLSRTIEDVILNAYGPKTCCDEETSGEDQDKIVKALQVARHVTMHVKKALGITGMDSPGTN